MTTIVEFLLARIAEAEMVAQSALDARGSTWWVNSREQTIVRGDPSTRAPIAEALSWRTAAHIAKHDPARVLAECEAKRRIVWTNPIQERWISEQALCDVEPRLVHAGWNIPEVLYFLAAVYADHPDFDEAWRPGVS